MKPVRLRKEVSSLAEIARQSPHTGYEPKSLIEVSSEHTPIKFPSRKASFNTDSNDLATTVAAPEITDTIEVGQLTSPLFSQEREVSANPFGVSGSQQQAASISSQQQQASSSVVHPWQDTDLWNSWNPMRGVESLPSVERSFSRGKRHKDFSKSVQLSSVGKGENSA